MIRLAACAAAALPSVLATVAQAATATVTRAWQFTPGADAGLALDNLVGQVTIEGAPGGGFHVTATITVEAGTDAEAQRLAGAVEFRTEDAGSTSRFQVLLPKKTFPVIHVARAPSGGFFFGRTYVDYLGERREISASTGKGVQVRVDLKVRVPEGARLKVDNRLGDVSAAGVVGSVEADTARGRITARDGRGRLELDTGSGAIEIANHDGDVEADTGSGAIRITDCRCRIEADTGSGGISVVRGAGELEADTGSGSIAVDGFAGSVSADTGSGSVSIQGLTSARALVVETGSGSVRIGGDLAGLERLDVQTGSGSVAVDATALPSMVIRMATGSGAIDAAAAGGELSREGRKSAVLRLADGRHEGRIRTGSGSIRLRLVGAPEA